ncbi:hypothetical protein [Streptomyces capoamus]
MAECYTCEDGRYDFPNPCPYIPPGSLAEQAMAMLPETEPEVFDVDGNL